MSVSIEETFVHTGASEGLSEMSDKDVSQRDRPFISN